MTTPREQRQLERFYNVLKARAPADIERFSWLHGPDLICLHNQYLNSNPRLVIIGQEVHEWYYNYREFVAGVWEFYYANSTSKSCVKKAIAEYQGFDFAYSDEEPGYRRTPFWKFFHTVREFAFPTERNAHQKVLWTNLIKFVTKNGSLLKKPYPEAEEAIQLQEDVLITELKIAKPHVCIFVTGPDYDCILKRYFRGVKFITMHGLNDQLFAKLAHKDLPHHSYRTYHPGYLRRQKKKWDQVLRILRRELTRLA